MADWFGCDAVCNTNSTAKNDDMMGTFGAPLYAGLATKITAYLANQFPYAGSRCTAALYKSSDNTLVATTQEVFVNYGDATPTLTDFDFSPYVQLSVQDYLVCVYCSSDENIRFWYTSVPGQKYVNQANIGTYPVFPDPLTSTTGLGMYMYCTYVPSGVGMDLKLTPKPKGGIGRPAMLTGGASFGG